MKRKTIMALILSVSMAASMTCAATAAFAETEDAAETTDDTEAADDAEATDTQKQQTMQRKQMMHLLRTQTRRQQIRWQLLLMRSTYRREQTIQMHSAQKQKKHGMH